MENLTHQQIEAVIHWMETWEQLKDTAIPIRFKEDFTKQLQQADVSERFSPIDKNDPTFEILFREGNWGAYDSQLTDMMREMVIRYNKLVEFLNAR